MINLLPSHYYHIYNHANGNENLFREDDNYLFFFKKYNEHISPIVETLSYCLLPNHFHMLLKIKDEEVLLKNAFPKFRTLEKLVSANYVSKQFSNFFSSYAQSYNKKYNRTGSLFMKNFKRKAVATDEYFSKLIHYIHANPVHHGFTKDMFAWRWSSYRSFLCESPTNISRKEVLDWFGGKEAFIRFHQQPVYLKTTDMFDN